MSKVQAVGIFLVPPSLAGIWVSTRIAGDFNGFWQVPGGKCKEGEHSLDAAIRETWEECGLQIEHDSLWKLSSGDYISLPSGTPYSATQYICLTTAIPAQAEPKKASAWTLHDWNYLAAQKDYFMPSTWDALLQIAPFHKARQRYENRQ